MCSLVVGEIVHWCKCFESVGNHVWLHWDRSFSVFLSLYIYMYVCVKNIFVYVCLSLFVFLSALSLSFSLPSVLSFLYLLCFCGSLSLSMYSSLSSIYHLQNVKWRLKRNERRQQQQQQHQHHMSRILSQLFLFKRTWERNKPGFYVQNCDSLCRKTQLLVAQVRNDAIAVFEHHVQVPHMWNHINIFTDL